MSESFLIGAMLSVVGGFWDAYTYIARGKVFANAQTGNIVLLGLNLARGEWHKAMLYAVPILAFVAGILIVELIRSRFQNISALHWRQIIIAAELVIITAVAFIPYGNMDIVANVLVSFVCSLQVQSFRKIKGEVCATTMCTGNLRSATDLLFSAIRDKDKHKLSRSMVYFGLDLIFLIGAVIGVVAVDNFGGFSLISTSAVLAIVLILMNIRPKKEVNE